MSRRSIPDKKVARLRKLMRQSLPVGFDLVQWLKDRRYAQTTGEAKRIILAKRVRSGSHTIGVTVVDQLDSLGKMQKVEVVDRYQPARYKSELIVLESE